MPPTFARPELLASPDWPAEHPPRPATDEFGSAMTGAGVGHGATAILYDDTASLYASRVWWSLRCYGFEGVRVLDGGWAAWVASGRPTPTAAARLRLSPPAARALLGSPDVELVDTRGPAEYRGQEGNAKRLGHIPGAVNVPAALLTVPGSQVFETPERLSRPYVEAGAQRGRRGGLYDGAGVGGGKAAFVLALLGYEDVAPYDS